MRREQVCDAALLLPLAAGGLAPQSASKQQPATMPLMGGVIGYGDDHWFVANCEYRQLLRAARCKLESPDDRQVLLDAEVFQNLSLDELTPEQLARVVAALRDVARSLQEAGTPPRDDREAGLRDHLAALHALLGRAVP